MSVPRKLIATWLPSAYFRAMAAVVRMLTLIALVMMPFTMGAAPAHAEARPAMAEGHCADEHQPPAPAPLDLAQCMLMCAALPAAEMLTVSPPDVPKAPRRLALAEPIHGVVLEIATPPPRRA